MTKADILDFFKEHKNEKFVVVNDSNTYFENIDTKIRYLSGVNWASTYRCIKDLVKEGDLICSLRYAEYSTSEIMSLRMLKHKTKKLIRCYQCS